MTPKILIVDDNLELAENLSEILEGEGFATGVFDDPRAARDQLSPGSHQLALIDMRMPHLDGATLFRSLRSVDPALPAIAMTAWSAQDGILDAVAAGFHGVLTKPLAPAHLVGVVRAVLDGPRALVVDDDPAFAANLTEILLLHGVAARAAPNCAEARRAHANLPATMLVVDSRLPDGDGAALLRELGASGGATAVQRILISAWDVEDQFALGLENISFMSKPLDMVTFLASLPGAGGAAVHA